MTGVCGHPTKKGGTCSSPIGLCPDCGHCLAHCEHREEERLEARSRGGKATARKAATDGLSEEELPALDGPRAAERWCELAARAVVTRRITHQEAKAVARLVREFLRSHESGTVTDRLDELMDALADWQETGDPGPVLELVEGGR